jgi:hypothetical protein
MVKLVHHTAEFGSINFEYHHSVITVGSAEDNDLVLPDPSVRPYHCQIVLDDDHLRVIAARDGAPPPEDSSGNAGRYSLGEQFMIGELLFEVQHSVNTTVAIPQAALDVPAQPVSDPTGKPYKCDQCHEFFFAQDVHIIGLEGRRKHLLCPKCSRPVSLVDPINAKRRGVVYWLKRLWRKILAVIFGRRRR